MLPEGVDEAFQVQIASCEQLGSPLYAELLQRAREDLQAGGVVARVRDGWRGKPMPDALPLRLLGAVHRIVLDGRAPRLAAHFPSAGGSAQRPAAWDALRETLEANFDEVRRRLDDPVQTNEVNPLRRAPGRLPRRRRAHPPAAATVRDRQQRWSHARRSSRSLPITRPLSG